jgi:hypothetical protein
MAIVTGRLVQDGENTTLYLSCFACGVFVDKIESREILAYLDYVVRTKDLAYCAECDQSQDDIIHPIVEEICALQNPVGNETSACLVYHSITDVIETGMS